MKANRQGRWSGVIAMTLLLAGGEVSGQSPAVPADPCEAPIPPEMGAAYDDNCWAYTPNSSGDMFTPLWEKNIKVDCPVLGWKTGDVADVVFCAKVGTSKTKTVSRSGAPDLKPGVIHCIFEAEDGYDCGNSDHACAIDPDTLSTAWKIETDHEVKDKSGTGTEAQFAVAVPEDATGPIKFEVAFTVAAEGGYSDLLKAKGCTLDVEAGKVPVTVHPVRLIIKTDPEDPLAGSSVNYRLAEDSLIPPGKEVTWNNFFTLIDCQLVQADAHALSGSFALPPNASGLYPIGVSVCDVREDAVISYRCHDCSTQIMAWQAPYNRLYELSKTLFELNRLLDDLYHAYGEALLVVMMQFGMQFGSASAGCVVPSAQAWKNAGEGLASTSAFLADQIRQYYSDGRIDETELERLNRAMQRAAELKSQLNGEIAKYEEVEGEINTLMEILPEREKEVSTCVQEVKYAALCEETMFSLLEAKGEKPQQQIGFYGEDFYCKPMSVKLPSFEMKKLTCIYYYGQLIYRGEN